jgi:hypothetical protein
MRTGSLTNMEEVIPVELEGLPVSSNDNPKRRFHYGG